MSLNLKKRAAWAAVLFSVLLAVIMVTVPVVCRKLQSTGQPVVILGPMECEIDYISSLLDHCETSRVGNAIVNTGTYKGIPIVTMKCRSGMVNSSAAATYAINELDPCMVIIQGTSGGHNPDLHQGDIVLGADLVELGHYRSKHRDSGQGTMQSDWEYTGATMLDDNNETTLVQRLHSTAELMEIAKNVPHKHGDVVLGTHGTADHWNQEMDMISFFHGKFGTDCEEMEGFAVAQVCTMYKVPFLAIRIISNSEHHPEELFSEDFGIYCQEYTLDVVEQCMTQQKTWNK